MDRLPTKELDSFKIVKNIVSTNADKLGPIVLSSAVRKDLINHLSCHVSHPWNSSCVQSAFYLLAGSFRKSLSVYASLYILSALLRGRPLKYYYTKLPHEVVRSTAFLAANCFYFLGFFCLARKLFGRVSYWGVLLANIPACFLSIIIERKQRRGLLALYLTNLATETGFNMMVDRKLISTIPNGEVLLFAVASSIYALLFKNFIGKAEAESTENGDHHGKMHRQSRVVKYYGVATTMISSFINICNNLLSSGGRHNRSHNVLVVFLTHIERRLERFLDSFSRSHNFKHHLCAHRYNCFIYPILGFLQRFTVGYLLQAGIKCLGSLGAILKNPKNLIKILKNPVNSELGMFLGCYVLIFRLVSCAFRWLTNKNTGLQALLAGFFSGWSMIFYKSSSIALYLNFKLIEVLWMLGVNSKKLPLFKSFDVILYSLSTAFILWVGLFEPHNLRPAYWKFLVKISNNKFALVDRFALDAFGTKASTIDRAIKAVKLI